MSGLLDRLMRGANGEAELQRLLASTGTPVRGVAAETHEAHLRIVEEYGERKELSREKLDQMAADDEKLAEFANRRDRIAIEHIRKIQNYLRGITRGHHVDALEIGDVARYWREYLGSGLLYASTLPRIRPPFMAAFYEYPFPQGGLPGAFSGEEPTRVGVLAFDSSLSGRWREDEGRMWDFSNLEHADIPDAEDKKEVEGSLLMLFCYLEFGKGEVVGPVSDMQIPITADGRAYADAEGSPAIRTLTALGLNSKPGIKDESPATSGTTPSVAEYASRERIYATLGLYLAQPVLLAHAFLHATNITPVEERPPDRLSRRHEKRYGRPLTVYKTLRVAPGYGDVGGTEGASDSSGERRRLHLCRGHFRTYRDKGPGGRTLDEPFSVWIPQHARGGKEQGEVNKEYAVEEPESRPGPGLSGVTRRSGMGTHPSPG